MSSCFFVQDAAKGRATRLLVTFYSLGPFECRTVPNESWALQRTKCPDLLAGLRLLAPGTRASVELLLNRSAVPPRGGAPRDGSLTPSFENYPGAELATLDANHAA